MIMEERDCFICCFSVPTEISGNSPVSPSAQDKSAGQSPLRSPLKCQASVCSTRLGSTKSLTAAFYGDKQPVTAGVQFSSDVTRSDENVLDSPKQRRSFGSFPYTPSADSNSFHQYQSMDSSMSVADSEAYFSAAEEFEPISSDEGPGTYPGRKKKKKQMQQIDYSRGSIYQCGRTTYWPRRKQSGSSNSAIQSSSFPGFVCFCIRWRR